MSFSPSTFTVEINGRPTIVFRAKWHAEADEICRGWANLHWDEIQAKEPTRRVQLPPVFKVRLAFATEKAAYEAANDDGELYGEVKLVRIIDTLGHQSDITENVPAAAEQQHAHIGDG
jgi:hypothetical protein